MADKMDVDAPEAKSKDKAERPRFEVKKWYAAKLKRQPC
jgi:hypothetical protein